MNETEPIRTAADWHLDRVRRAGREQLRELEAAVVSVVSHRVRAKYPTAATLHAYGEHNEDGLLHLHTTKIVAANGDVLASNEESDPQEWDGFIDEIDDLLDELSERDEDYQGNHEFDLLVDAPQVPVLLVYGDPADGFRYVGPITPNDPAVDAFIDTELRATTWWYVPLYSLTEAREAAG